MLDMNMNYWALCALQMKMKDLFIRKQSADRRTVWVWITNELDSTELFIDILTRFWLKHKKEKQKNNKKKPACIVTFLGVYTNQIWSSPDSIWLYI